MKHIHRFLLLTALLTMALLPSTGCKTTLSPTGVYQGDQVLYNADKAIDSSYDILHSFVKWEHDNRVALAAYPAITQSADYVRDNAKKWITSAVNLREAYSKEPNQANKDALASALNVLQTVLTESSKYMANTKIPKQ